MIPPPAPHSAIWASGRWLPQASRICGQNEEAAMKLQCRGSTVRISTASKGARPAFGLCAGGPTPRRLPGRMPPRPSPGCHPHTYPQYACEWAVAVRFGTPLSVWPRCDSLGKYEAPRPGWVGRCRPVGVGPPEGLAVAAATGGCALYAPPHSPNQPRVMLSGSRFLRTFPRLGGSGFGVVPMTKARQGLIPWSG